MPEDNKSTVIYVEMQMKRDYLPKVIEKISQSLKCDLQVLDGTDNNNAIVCLRIKLILNNGKKRVAYAWIKRDLVDGMILKCNRFQEIRA